MYIILAGGGVAGTTLATELVNRKHDVVVIDRDRDACELLYTHTGAVAINGSATELVALKEAGIEKADLAIGAMYRDPDNLTFALLAKSFGVTRIMVKMRDPAYAEAYRVAGVDVVCNMIAMFRRQILSEIDNPHIRVLSRLEGTDAELVMFRFPPVRDPDGVAVRKLAKHPAFANECVFAGILAQGSQHIVMPRGDDRVRPGDTLFVVVKPRHLPVISKFLERA